MCSLIAAEYLENVLFGVQGGWPDSRLDEGEETFLKNVEDRGEEEGQGQEYEQLVRQLAPVVLEDQLSSQVDGSCHAFELLVCFLHCPGGRGWGEGEEWCQKWKKKRFKYSL